MSLRICLVILFLLFFPCTHPIQRPKPFTIMLEPAGDAKHAGREIDDCFERGITLQFAESLKKNLEVTYPGIRVILSRFAGESLEPLQNANFANRLQVDFYLSIHFFLEKEEKPQLFLYQFAYNATTDFWPFVHKTLIFIPYDQAHRAYAQLSKTYGKFIVDHLQTKKYKKYFETKGLFALPFKPLIGINCPALALEASLKNKNDWKVLVSPLIQSLQNIIALENQ